MKSHFNFTMINWFPAILTHFTVFFPKIYISISLTKLYRKKNVNTFCRLASIKKITFECLYKYSIFFFETNMMRSSNTFVQNFIPIPDSPNNTAFIPTGCYLPKAILYHNATSAKMLLLKEETHSYF